MSRIASVALLIASFSRLHFWLHNIIINTFGDHLTKITSSYRGVGRAFSLIKSVS